MRRTSRRAAAAGAAAALAAAALAGARAELPLVALGIGPCPSTGLYIDIGVQSVAAACGVDPTCEASPGMEPCPGTSCDVAYVCYDGESCDPLGGAEINATAGMPGDGAVTTEAFRCQVLKAVHPDAYDADLVVGMGFTFYDPMMTVSGMFPEKDFAIIDAAYDPPIPNVEAFYYTEDQVGFLAGVAMCEVAKKLGGDKVGLIGGIPIPPVKKFINGAVVGCYDVLPEATIYVEYGESFNNMDNEGVKMAQDMEAEGVSVVFAAGGGTGSEGLKHLAANGIYVIGVDVDEYVTTFGNGTVDGSEYVLTSALKKVDVGIVDAVNCFLYDWESCAGKNNMMSAANDGVGMAPCHEACEVYDETIQKQVDDLFMALKDDAISTGVDEMGDIIELDEVVLGRRRRLMMLNRPSDLVL